MDLHAAAGLAGLAAALALLDAPVALRLPVGLPAVLFFPGYAAGAALFPRSVDLTVAERIALAVGLSLAAIAVLSIGLHYSPWGLTLPSVSLSVAGLTCAAAAVAGWRRRRTPPAERFGVAWPAAPVALGRVLGQRRSRRAGIVGAVAGSAALLAVAAVLALVARRAEVTEFYVLGRDRLVQSYPRAARPGEAITTALGVTNREGRPVRYFVVVLLGEQVLAAVPPFELGDRDTWTDQVTFALPAHGFEQSVDILLFRAGRQDPYRRLRLVIDVPEPGVPTPVGTVRTPVPTR